MLKINVDFNPLNQMYMLDIHKENGGGIQAVFSVNDSMHSVAQILEDRTNNFTLTTSHKNIYKEAFTDTQKKYTVALEEVEVLKKKLKQLTNDHLELLGVMKKVA